jgi:RNA polymerase-binding transcription factor
VTEAARAAEVLAAARAEALALVAGLERDLRAIIESAGSAGDDDEHDPEGATVAFERQHTAALLAQARGQLAEADRALRRLAGGSYGSCERCGQPIGAARLAARPVAALCLACARRSSAPRTRRPG